ncbi:sulfate adenylyltransferase subunit 1 [Crocinitomix catalasitica]|uniref:sulfate adenylyltransferase subunit 1 n=1 Tax=Crocinitomix catalasitica TaxID=184607 RepID=UPI00048943D6|nr:GTP-binding protein [Crocinitomix catalasitica]
MSIIRISTAGSVDDGKSTLIGRLLFDTKSLPQDKIDAIQLSSEKKGLKELDLALITDGLTAEREQGITIDVAHIFFSTASRKYIIADTPGHVEYTRNMVTGASNSQVSMILIDARKGILEQTRRHLFIAKFLEMEQVLFVINKMDLMDYNQQTFESLKDELLDVCVAIDFPLDRVSFVPISAKVGDNVVEKSKHMDWYSGPTILGYLEQLNLRANLNDDFRFNVQYVVRPQSADFSDFRGYAGKVKSGTIKVGDEIQVNSSGQKSRVLRIFKGNSPILEAGPEASVLIELEKAIDISRGDTLTQSHEDVVHDKNLIAQLCWLDKRPLNIAKKYLLRHAGFQTIVAINEVVKTLDFDTLNFMVSKLVEQNTICEVEIKAAAPIYLDNFKRNKKNGYFILVDRDTNATVAVGVKQ